MRPPNPLTVTGAATLQGSGNENQDAYTYGDNFAVVIDGATAFEPTPGVPSGGWYARTLASHIERIANAYSGNEYDLADPREIIAQAISATANEGNLIAGNSPYATVALATWNAECLNIAVLGDCTVVVRLNDETETITDDRINNVAKTERAAYVNHLRTGHGFNDRLDKLLAQLQREQHQYRNVNAGFWVAEAEPDAAQHVLDATYWAGTLQTALLMTDGAANGIHRYGLAAMTDNLTVTGSRSQTDFLTHVQQVEIDDPKGATYPRSKPSDDKTLIDISR